MNPQYIFKIIIIGNSGVGKTNILSQYMSNIFDHNTKSTIGLEFYTKDMIINNNNVKAQIWDTAGQERFKSISNIFYAGTSGAFIVYDITDYISFLDCQKWYSELINSRINNDIPIFLIGNKCDKNIHRQVSIETAEKFAASNNMQHYEISALDNYNIDLIFYKLTECVFNNKISQINNIVSAKEIGTHIHQITFDKKNTKSCC
ncbi:Ras family GTPase [Catovirus CTV1]|uniref:Ras family GTPase n=1 Tax=Catovirus CTV1 TaxID=1977631 RepID=A0A1V0S9J6_9VIRU|nr:Ras family GTPase [Catovirus CTV1]